MPQRGLLIVVEGLDRSGKTTQCTLLTSRLQSLGYKVRYQKFPDRTTTTGQIINAYLTNLSSQSDHAIHLLFSTNRWEAVGSILTDLDHGTTVIVDRYSFSGAVYSAAKGRDDLDLEWAWAPEIGLPKPDLCLFLDIDEEKARERGGYGDERYEKEEMQRRVRSLYGKLFNGLVQQQDLNVKKIDAGNDLDHVANQMWEGFEETENNCEYGPIQKLEKWIPAAEHLVEM